MSVIIVSNLVWKKKKICRPCLFKKAMRKFNVAWWAYSYPITILALASTRYAQEVNDGVAHALRLFLSALSVLVIFGLLLCTAFHPSLLFGPTFPTYLSAN